MYVIPKARASIDDPERGDVLPKKGRDVHKSQYWLRRIDDGDVTLKAPPKPKRGKTNVS